MTEPPTTRPITLMDQLFVLNVGVLFGAFFAIGIWTQGVPRKLATLGGFVAGITLLITIAASTLCASGLHRQQCWLARLTGVTWLVACGAAWSTWSAVADPAWPYQHPTLVIATALLWGGCGILALLWARTPADPVSGAVCDMSATLAALGMVAHLVAATIYLGTLAMWPSYIAQHSIEWYVWISQGVAHTMISAGVLLSLLLHSTRSQRDRWGIAIWCLNQVVAASVLCGWVSAPAIAIAQVAAGVWFLNAVKPSD